jgi:hypothetical protein
MNSKSFYPRFINILMLFVVCFLFNLPIRAQQINYSAKTTIDLYANFETAKKFPCGQRDEAIAIGKVIIERFDDGELKNETNKRVIDWAKM